MSSRLGRGRGRSALRRIRHCDLAGYLVPVHTDIGMIDAVILDGFDDKASVLGVKGLGELGICGGACEISRSPWTCAARCRPSSRTSPMTSPIAQWVAGETVACAD